MPQCFLIIESLTYLNTKYYISCLFIIFITITMNQIIPIQIIEEYLEHRKFLRIFVLVLVLRKNVKDNTFLPLSRLSEIFCKLRVPVILTG